MDNGWYNEHRTDKEKADRLAYYNYNRVATRAGISSSTFRIFD